MSQKNRRDKPNSLNSLKAVYSERWDERHDTSDRSPLLQNCGRNHKYPGPISVHFDDIARVIEGLIHQNEVAVGAIAWLTNKHLLAAMTSLERVAVVVQKEDFLRNDTAATDTDFYKQLRHQYAELNPISANDFPDSYPGCQDYVDGLHHCIAPHLLSYKGLHVEGSVRSMGYFDHTRTRTLPKMHHKFIVLGKYREDHLMYPHCVITGSYNWSHNAENSRENILVIRDPNICQDYVSEWAQLWARSEVLDWESTSPEIQRHHIGT